MSEEKTAQLTDASRELPLGRMRLLVMWDAHAEHVDLPTHGELKIGRAKQCDVIVEHASVSRAHAAIEARDGHVCIRDLGSQNGTRVNGRKLTLGESAPFRAGMLAEIGRAILVLQRRDSMAELREPADDPLLPPPGGLIAPEEGPMRQVLRLVAQVAKSKLCVLLLGETGVGKELVAEAVHRWSPRASGPFVRLNCAALTESLLESELFGHERGSFTGALQSKKGLIEAADGGTLFLDEIGELPAPTQAKLLRALEAREVLRVGALEPRAVDFRLVSATHRDLEAATSAGAFRSDLFFRINGISIGIPPLRARTNEIAGLAAAFSKRACEETKRPPIRFSREAIAALESHPWPGNVRELKNTIERAVALTTKETFDAADLFPAGTKAAPSSATLAEDLSEIEKRRILDALERVGGNQSEVARMLGIPRRTLLRRLKEYGIGRMRK